MSANNKTLIFGASGKTGQAIVKTFLAKDGPEKIALAVRDPEAARTQFNNSSLEIRPFDYQDSNTWSGLFTHIKKVYLISPPKDDKAYFQMMQLLYLMKEQAVQKIIFLSGRTTGDIPDSFLNKMELMVIQSGLTYVILRPGWFMQNFAIWFKDMIQQEDAILLPAGNSYSAFIDVQNIADVVHALMRSKKCDNQIIDLTGDELHTHYDVAKIFSEILERDIVYMPLPDNEYIHAMLNRKWPEAKARKMVELYRIVKSGKEERISDSYKNIMGKKPNSFKDFVKRYADVWKR